MSEPRCVPPGKIWMLTRRCTQRQFLLSPDPAINNAFLYCLIEAAQKFDIVLLLSQMLSNHHHTPFFDPTGNAIEFTHRFHTNLAKCTNAYRDHEEAVWSSDPPSLVELVGVGDLVDKLIYTATNPVKHGLVEHVHQWPGPKTVRAFLQGRTLRARRPPFFFRADGDMPEEVEIQLRIPEEIGNHDDIVERVRVGIAEVEARCAAERTAPVLGRRRVLRQSWRDNPRSKEPRRKIRPRVAARNKEKRIRVLQRNKDFQTRYRAARELWLAGKPALFPVGTYWLRKFAGVSVEPTSPPVSITTSN